MQGSYDFSTYPFTMTWEVPTTYIPLSVLRGVMNLPDKL